MREGIPMDGIIAKLSRQQRRKLERTARRCQDAKLRIRYLIVVNLAAGRTASDTAAALNASSSSVYRVAHRFREGGEAGLVDRREGNGEEKLTEKFLYQLYEVVASSPQECGWERPTWTQELLIQTMVKKTGIAVSRTTMSKALQTIGARRGRPKPVVHCPWSKQQRDKTLRNIARLVESLPENEIVVYEDEVDIHLNPKIGCDWMVPGQQKKVTTPGQNVKRYLAGAYNPHSGELIWVEGEQKRSLLFIQLLWALQLHYPDARRIHVILDNYSIHSTEQVTLSLQTVAGSRFELHFLPPYCPDHNKIERIWQDLHANVTRNHTCPEMPQLMQQVSRYLKQRNQQATAHYALAG
jgi:transposase